MRGATGRVARHAGRPAARRRNRRRGSCMAFPPGERSYAGLRCGQSPLLQLRRAEPPTATLRVLPKCLGDEVPCKRNHVQREALDNIAMNTTVLKPNAAKLEPREEHH